jgi:nucleoid-associated protein YgaU
MAKATGIRRNTLFYPEIWQKSYLIEIIYPNKSMEVYTFSLPPEGSEIVMTQRVSETETFGGVFVDDYGMGLAKIHLSGSTGNSNFKKIHRGDKSDIWLTGKEEIFYLRDAIIRYKEQEKLKGEGSSTMFLYNLNAVGSAAYEGNMHLGADFMDAWEVVLKDFKIIQSKEKPFTYNYAIDFTGVRLLGTSKIIQRPAPVIGNGSLAKAKWLQAALEFMEKFYAVSESAKNAVEKARAAVSGYADEVENYLHLVTGNLTGGIENFTDFFNTPTDIFTDTWGSLARIYASLRRATIAPADSALRMVHSIGDLRRTIERDLEDMKTPLEQWDALGGDDSGGSVGSAVESDIEAYKRNAEDDLQDTENAVNLLYTETTSSANPEAVIVPKIVPEPEGDSGSEADVVIDVVVSYGYMRHIANSETSLEGLAERYLGDPVKAYIIAAVNGISSDEDIQPGDQLKIPILSQNSMNALNHVFGSVDNRDALGIDIALDQGIPQVGTDGDFSAKTYYDNMDQAISMRLSESVGNRIRLSTYGIRDVAGLPDSVARSYILTSIKDTVMQDPRVERIEELYFSGSGDNLQVEFTYYTYDGVLHRYEGAL